ncbi:hypothetical protein FXO38_02594 [Capsicum annuum]|nr:hypothetical protein FXO38_02594 [Capsicum annuum]
MVHTITGEVFIRLHWNTASKVLDQSGLSIVDPPFPIDEVLKNGSTVIDKIPVVETDKVVGTDASIGKDTVQSLLSLWPRKRVIPVRGLGDQFSKVISPAWSRVINTTYDLVSSKVRVRIQSPKRKELGQHFRPTYGGHILTAEDDDNPVISTTYSPAVEGSGDDYDDDMDEHDEEVELPLAAIIQDPQFEEGSQDESNAMDEKQSSAIPQSEEGTDQEFYESHYAITSLTILKSRGLLRLCPTVADNVLTWDRVALIMSIMTGYDIDSLAIIQHELHERDFVGLKLYHSCVFSKGYVMRLIYQRNQELIREYRGRPWQEGLFRGQAHENPNTYVKGFVEVGSPFNIAHTSQESIRLHLFHFSLMGKAVLWLRSLHVGSITPWLSLKEDFISQYFPPSKISHYPLNTIISYWKALVDVEASEMKFWLNNEQVSIKVCKSMKKLVDLKVFLVIDAIDGELENHIDMSLLDDPLLRVL